MISDSFNKINTREKGKNVKIIPILILHGYIMKSKGQVCNLIYDQNTNLAKTFIILKNGSLTNENVTEVVFF